MSVEDRVGVQARPVTVTVTVRLFAGAKAAAGRGQVALQLPAGSQVSDVLGALVAAYPGVGPVIPACSFLVDGVRAGARSPLADSGTLDVLPPFSGG